MAESESVSSLNRANLVYEIDYLSKLSVVHKCVMLHFMRDRNSIHLVKKIRPELNKIYVSNEFKDVTRLINKSSTPDHHGIDIVMTDVDHTTQRLLELLNKRKTNDETRRLPCIPVIVLMPVNVDEDIKQHVLTTGGVDVILQQPVTAKAVFAAVLHLLHQRSIVEGAYSGLRKQHISTKYPHLQVFMDEKSGQKTGDGEEEDEEDEEDTVGGDDSLDGELQSATLDVEVDENYSSAELHPAPINDLRSLYSKVVKKRTYTLKSSMLGPPRSADLKFFHYVDRHIVKCILADNALDASISLRDDSDSDDENKSADAEGKRGTRRQAHFTASTSVGVGTRDKQYYRSDSYNIVDEAARPRYRPSTAPVSEGSLVEGSESTLFGSDLLPFVDKPRPDMSRPKSVGGMNRKSTMACWKVLHVQKKFGPGHVEHKHDKPWNTNATKKKLESNMDDYGTLKLSVAKKIVKQTDAAKSHSNADGNRPVHVDWNPPARFLHSNRLRRRFESELTQTKKRLKALALNQDANAGNIGKLVSPQKPLIEEVKTIGSPMSTEKASNSPECADQASGKSESSTAVNVSRLNVVREWRGIAEDDTYNDLGEKTTGTAKKLPSMLRAAGGVQFGNMIIGAKARLKARRLVRDMASSALRDPDTSRLIPVNLDNRRIGSGEREHLIVGINHEKQGHLVLANKAFSKALLSCKQTHIIYICRGNVQFQRGKFFSAISDYTASLKEIEVSPELFNMHLGDVVIARYNRAMSLFRLGDDEKGLEDLKFAVMCEPDNDYIRETLVMAHRRCSQYVDAIEHCTILHKNAKTKKEKDEMLKLKESTISLMTKRTGNTASDHVKAIRQYERTSDGTPKQSGPIIRPQTSQGPSSMSARVPTNRPGTSPATGRYGGVSAHSLQSTSTASGAPISLINSRFMSESFTTGNMGAMDDDMHIPKVNIQEHEFPTMKTLKEAYQSKMLNDEVTQATLHLENFKHANGFKRHLFDTLFVRLSPLQDALITDGCHRTQEQLRLIADTLRAFPVFSKNSEVELYELASHAEYRTVTTKSTIFYQEDPVDGMLLLLNGQIQLRLESGQETKTLATMGAWDTYGELALLFRNKHSQFVERLHKTCLNGDLNSAFLDDQQSTDEDDDAARSADTERGTNTAGAPALPRSLQPGSFMSCKVSSPSEIILIQYPDFDRMVREQFENEFLKHLELLRASGVFTDLFSPQELIRLARMTVVRRYHQGETIIAQGEEPNFLYFVMKGTCKVIKRPDPSEYLVRRLAELKETAKTFDQKYAFHHRLRGTFTPASEECRRNHPDIPHMTAAEEEREATETELTKLTVQVKRVKATEEKRREDEEELKRLGREVPNMSVDIAALHWPQVFGEVAVLQPEGGTCLGTVMADTVVEILCVHKVHLQTFQIDERLLDRVKQRAVHYPPDETLVKMLLSSQEWNGYKKSLMHSIRKDKWPSKGKGHA